MLGSQVAPCSSGEESFGSAGGAVLGCWEVLLGAVEAPLPPHLLALGTGAEQTLIPGWGGLFLHSSSLQEGGCALCNQQNRVRNPSSSLDAGGG